MLGKLSVPGRPTIWINVGQGLIALAVGAGGGCLDIFYSHLSFLSSFSLSLVDGPILTEILSQRAVKPKTTNKPQQIVNHYNNNKAICVGLVFLSFQLATSIFWLSQIDDA